jgi:GrpB-like predicted nucleotidyltransferase (UPF0157 family)
MRNEEEHEFISAQPETPSAVQVVDYDSRWPEQFELVATDLHEALAQVPIVGIEHVGSTSVPGLAAKPIIDIDIIVEADAIRAAIEALEAVGYKHIGDLGLPNREAFDAPDDDPERHVYLCTAGTLHLRNHLAVRNALRSNSELRDAYANVKRSLSADPSMDIDRYTEGKSDVLQQVLAESELTDEEKLEIRRLNKV